MLVLVHSSNKKIITIIRIRNNWLLLNLMEIGVNKPQYKAKWQANRAIITKIRVEFDWSS